MGIFICGCGRNFKRGFVNVPEKYIYVEQNLSKKISVLENAGSTKAAALMQMIIEEIQLRQANYRYTVSTLAFNLVLFFDRLDNENIKFQNNSRETSDYTRKIISYIELHYMEDIGGKDFARACNLSETHMRRIFIESANITPSEYLNLVRIKKACEMLAKEKCSIEKVSNSVGYPVISTFMRNFKKITGISPNAWRRKALENPENVAAYQVSVFKGIGGTQQQHGLHLLRFIGDHLRTAMKRRRGIGHGELVRNGRRIGDCRQAYRRVFRQQLPLLAVTGAVEIHHMVRLIHHRGDRDGVGLPFPVCQRQGGIGSLLEYLPGKGGIPLPILSQHCFFLLIRRPGHPVLPRSLDQQPTGYAGKISDIFK